jgi:hypothetical protein
MRGCIELIFVFGDSLLNGCDIAFWVIALFKLAARRFCGKEMPDTRVMGQLDSQARRS